MSDDVEIVRQGLESAAAELPLVPEASCEDCQHTKCIRNRAVLQEVRDEINAAGVALDRLAADRDRLAADLATARAGLAEFQALARDVCGWQKDGDPVVDIASAVRGTKKMAEFVRRLGALGRALAAREGA